MFCHKLVEWWNVKFLVKYTYYLLNLYFLFEFCITTWIEIQTVIPVRKQESTFYAKWCHSSVSEINHILPFYFGMLHHSQFWQLHWTNDRCSFCTWTVFKFWPSKAIHYKIRHSLAAFQVPFSRHMESFWHIFTFRPTFWFWSLSYRNSFIQSQSTKMFQFIDINARPLNLNRTSVVQYLLWSNVHSSTRRATRKIH